MSSRQYLESPMSSLSFFFMNAMKNLFLKTQCGHHLFQEALPEPPRQLDGHSLPSSMGLTVTMCPTLVFVI